MIDGVRQDLRIALRSLRNVPHGLPDGRGRGAVSSPPHGAGTRLCWWCLASLRGCRDAACQTCGQSEPDRCFETRLIRS